MSNPRTEHRCTGPDCGATFMAVAARLCPECCQKRRRKPVKYAWTLDKLEYLRAHYDSRIRGRVQAIADRFAWPTWVIRKRATELRLTRLNPMERAWTREEDAILDKWAGRRSTYWISQLLSGRTHTAVVMRFKRREISRAFDGYTARSLAVAMGVDHKTISRWVSLGLLKAIDRKPDDGNTPWHFTHYAVRTFVKRNPTAFRLDKVDQTWFLALVFGDGAFNEARAAA